MEKREKKIVVTLLVIALFGVSQLIVSSTGNDNITDSQTDVISFVKTIRTDLVKTSLNESEKTVMVHLHNEPVVDPFVDAPAPPGSKITVVKEVDVVISKADVLSSSESNKFRYTGYLLMDTEKIAIVNGKEYSVGQTIAGSNVVLQRINSFAIVLKNMSNKQEFSAKYNFNKQH